MSDSIAIDISGNDAHGTISGGVSIVPGFVGNAFRFDGEEGSRISGALCTFSGGNSPISIAAWFNHPIPSGQNQSDTVGSGIAGVGSKAFGRHFYQRICSTCTQYQPIWNHPLLDSENRYWSGADNPGDDKWWGSNTVIAENVWNYGVTTWDPTSNEVKIYINGVLDRTVTLLADLDLTDSFYIGGDPYDDNWSHGLIDEIQIFNRTLLSSEILTQFQAGSAGNCKEPLPAPEVTCPSDISASNDPGLCGAIVTFPAPTASVTCGTVTCEPASSSFFPVGTTVVNCTTTLGPSCTFNVTVDDTEAPVLTCPDDITVSNDPGQCSAAVHFSVSASDNCAVVGSPTCTPASGSTFPLGTTTVDCVAADSAGNTATCSFTVTVLDETAPSLEISAEPVVLWPPNHQYVTIDVSQFIDAVSDNCEDLALDDVVIISVSCDEEEDAPGGGDGNTNDDIVITSCHSVDLRAERQGSRNGRVYLIDLEVSDSQGNTASAELKVSVPKSQNGDSAVDDGSAYSISSNCSSDP